MVPILFVLIAIYLVIGPIIESPQIELLYAFLFIIGGLVFYFPFVYFKLKIKGFGKILTSVSANRRFHLVYFRDANCLHKNIYGRSLAVNIILFHDYASIQIEIPVYCEIHKHTKIQIEDFSEFMRDTLPIICRFFLTLFKNCNKKNQEN